MTGREDITLDGVERTVASADRHREAWKQTLEDAVAMADAREEDGWDTLVVHPLDTATEPPEAGDTDRYGLVHVVPDNVASDVAERTDGTSFPRYDVYRATVEGRLFLLTVLLAPAEHVALYVAGSIDLSHARRLFETAAETETLYTHLQTLDGTPIASFAHEAYEKFVPSSLEQT